MTNKLTGISAPLKSGLLSLVFCGLPVSWSFATSFAAPAESKKISGPPVKVPAIKKVASKSATPSPAGRISAEKSTAGKSAKVQMCRTRLDPIEGLHPQARKKLGTALSEMKRQGIEPKVTSSFRSSADQKSLYNCARRTVCRKNRGVFGARPPGESLHEAGLAVDVAGVASSMKRNRRLTPQGKKIVRIMEKNGFDWRYGMRDPVHFELNARQAGFRAESAAIKSGQSNWTTKHRKLKKDCAPQTAGRKVTAKEPVSISRQQKSVRSSAQQSRGNSD